MHESDLNYYERRLAEELREADRTDSSEVRAVHSKLAEMYRQRIVGLTQAMPLSK
jgi:hypothetical protein